MSRADPVLERRTPGLQFDFTRIPIAAPPIQREPIVSSPGDPFEREADEVADKVMWMAEPAPIDSTPATIQRKCAECEDEEKKPNPDQACVLGTYWRSAGRKGGRVGSRAG